MFKKLVLIAGILLIASTCFAAIDDIGGFYWTPVTKTDSTVSITPSTETDTVVWTPAGGMKITLLGVTFSSDLATTLLIETGSTAVIPTTECTASGVIVIGNGTPIWKGAADETLTYTISAISRHSILLWGYEGN